MQFAPDPSTSGSSRGTNNLRVNRGDKSFGISDLILSIRLRDRIAVVVSHQTHLVPTRER